MLVKVGIPYSAAMAFAVTGVSVYGSDGEHIALLLQRTIDAEMVIAEKAGADDGDAYWILIGHGLSIFSAFVAKDLYLPCTACRQRV